MFIKLHNFRCYENAEFDFGDQGLVLLSGSSGKGKSTILMAIDFVLFGNGSKIISHGKKSCSVEFKLQDLKVVRKKGPNYLIVNDIYEDAAGEAIIIAKFGKIFNSVSYIPQNLKKSFVLMSPTDRLEFLETFAFNNFDILTLKERAKSIIRENNDTLLKVIGKLQYANELFLQKKEPHILEFPAKVSKDNIEKYVQNQKIKEKNALIRIKKYEKEILILREKENSKNILLTKKEEKEEMHLQYEKELILLTEDSISKENEVSLKQKIELFQNQLSSFLKHKEFIILSQKYNENKSKLEILKTNELNELSNEQLRLKENLWQQGDEEELKDQIETWDILIQNKKQLFSLPKIKPFPLPLEEYEKQYSICQSEISRLKYLAKLEKENLTCPSCQKKLRMQNNTLISSEDAHLNQEEIQRKLKDVLIKEKEYNQIIDQCKTQLKTQKTKDELEKIIHEMDGDEFSIEECQTAIKETECLLQLYISNEKKLKEISFRLDTRKFSNTIIQMEKGILMDEQKLLDYKLYENIGELIDEEKIRNELQFYKTRLEMFQKYTSQFQMVSSKHEKIKQEIENINIQLSSFTNENYSDQKLHLENEIFSQKEIIKDVAAFFEKYTLFLQNQSEVLEYKKSLQQIESLQEEENILRKKYSSSCQFRDYILEAESIYICNLIQNINTHVQMYLDHFFPEHPISIRLNAFKENAKNETKPSIQLEIDYKGMEHDLTMLSGGELSRVILSFTLAFADIYNSPLILLDECTASLDQTLTTSVIEGLKENFGNKLIVLIAHQVVQGSFDKVIQL
jgi:exonuclease SbcC